MRLITILSLCLMSLNAGAQNSWLAQNAHYVAGGYSINSYLLNEDDSTPVITYLQSRLSILKQEYVSLRLTAKIKSNIGVHYAFIQTWKGIDIYGSEVKINIANDGRMMSLFEKTISTDRWWLSKAAMIPNSANVLEQLHDPELLPVDAKSVIFIKGENTPVSAFQINYTSVLRHEAGTLIVDEAMNILYDKDNVMNFVAKDTTARALVFLPDPLTTANIPYGMAPYLNHHDSDEAVLDSQRKLVNIPVRLEKDMFGNDSFYLQSPYMYFSDRYAPSTMLPEFYFTRNMPAFQCVMAYYHINVHHHHLIALGFDSLCNYALQVNANDALLGDNSQFVPDYGNPNKSGSNILQFGTGGIPDAQDADVIVHEYSHAIRQSAAPNTFNGVEREATEEGFCDYFACSYSKFLSLNQWQKCFNWDGDGEFWPGRTCSTTKVYPKDYSNTDFHINGEIFSGSLMDIYDEIGRDTTDMLMLTAEYSLASNMTMPQVANLVLLADSYVCKGRHAGVISCKFAAHGLMSDSLCKVSAIAKVEQPTGARIESRYFKNGIIYLRFDLPQSGVASLYSLDGKLIFNSPFLNQTDLTFFEPQLASGLYLLHITTGKSEQAVKLLKE